MDVRFYFIILFLLSTSTFAQPNQQQSDPTTALENSEFDSINYAALDSVPRDYIKAIEHSLYQRFHEAEPLMKKVALGSDASLSEVARFYLLNELYFWRGKYTDYLQFADQINKKEGFYELAQKLVVQPPATIHFSTDNASIPITIHKRSYVIANVLLSGKPTRLILDSGASLTIISEQLAHDLRLTTLTSMVLQNSVGTQTVSSVSRLDSLSLGNVAIKNALVAYTTEKRLFRKLHVDGLLGWDILRQLSYTIDFQTKTLLIRKPVTDSTVEKNLFGISSPFLTVYTAAGQKLNLFFDSGSNYVDLAQKGAAKLGNYKIGRRPGTISGIGKTKIGLLPHVKNFTFTIGSQSFTRRRTYLTSVEHIILNVKTDGVLLMCELICKEGDLFLVKKDLH